MPEGPGKPRAASWSIALAATALPAAAYGGALMNQSGEVPRARDGDIAIREEYCAARKANTVAAYDLFIARHPGHPLVEEARRLRERIVKKVG